MTDQQTMAGVMTRVRRNAERREMIEDLLVAGVDACVGATWMLFVVFSVLTLWAYFG